MSAKEVIKNGICYMCTHTCPSIVYVNSGKATKIDRADAHLQGLCPRFNAQLDFIYHPDRLTHPLRRTGERGSGSFERISWDEALDTIANSLSKVKDKYGAEAVAFWVAYTKEPRPYFQRLAHAFGSPNFCTESSSCASSAVLASYVTYGMRQISPPAIQSPARCSVFWGSSLINSHITLWPKYLKAKNEGLKLIVVDPRRTKLASMADIHLQLRPGTDGALALGMINMIISENLYDHDFVEEWTVGFDDLKKLSQKYTPEHTEQITGVPAPKIREAAILFASRKPSEIVMSANSTTHHTNGVQNHRAVILLQAITGNIEVPHLNGYLSRAASTNDITLRQATESMPPGVGSKRFSLWTKLKKEMQSNALIEQIDSADPYPIKALMSAGLNIQFFPNSNHMVEGLKKLDFIAVTEYFQTPATQFADVVLPIASWLEREILQGLRSGHISLIEPAIEPVGECWPEWKIYSELARRLGFGEKFWDGDFEKCVNHILEPSGITYEDLKKHPDGIKLSSSSGVDERSQKAGFSTPSGKVEIASSILAENGYEAMPVYKEPPESPVSQPDVAKDYPLVLTTGARVLAYTHSQFRNIDRLRKLAPDPLIDINPDDAGPRGISSGDRVIIISPRGSIKMKANVTDSILAGVVSVPHHWPGDANANILIDDVNLDPISGFPPFKSQLCQVSKA
ncbi:MAG: molybdopterin-dependent oxidoreductase [Chloroflexi bacterium]|jgi:anaerobic selenocysteine-containing dehydrogenase|nr:molybdopterin-dependent oxidoreductase [Chloroflexota bacterium]